MALRFLKASLGAAMIFGAQAAHAQQPAPAGDAELAHRHKTAMCVGCHGIPGYKTAFPEVYHVPKIAGQQPAYLINALKAYKSGERNNPIMKGFTAQLSRQDMEDLAAWFSSQKSRLHDQR